MSQNSIRILEIEVIEIFDSEGKLKVITPDSWNEEWITLEREQKPDQDFDDEIPF